MGHARSMSTMVAMAAVCRFGLVLWAMPLMAWVPARFVTKAITILEMGIVCQRTTAAQDTNSAEQEIVF